ncbi:MULTISPECIES: glycosyltransferase family 4 protein [Paenibacillus]|uniref:Glycosyltransferase subfamily 4-like N-terminal domain-containing protein n=1 Tax=Paenibacillus albilobatus TaxID=2716884 RepID=A0A919XGU4_9BACL|nr:MULTISPECIES: glycosyltransferase [Paenibacillus]GIO30138.1 hypothetical protein J2TS6_12790 [Paenibacillus albilobatus]
MKIVIIGPAPPPNGGISIHIKRIVHGLKNRGMDYTLYNESPTSIQDKHIVSLKSYKTFFLKFPFIRGDVFHFHSINKHLRMLLGVYALLGKKIILTVHGESLIQQLQSAGPWTRFLLIQSLRRIDGIICVNAVHTNELVKWGLHEENIQTIPSYLEPVESPEDAARIPESVYQWMESAPFLISANGSVRLLDGKDLYGIDQLIELMRRLTDSGFDACLLFTVLGVSALNEGERRYYHELKQKIVRNGLENRFWFYEAEDTEFYPILQKSKLFIRPTLQDGYGVSIAEALHYGVPSIASDVCVRPEGTIGYRAGDVSDLLDKVKETVQNYVQVKQRIQRTRPTGYFDELLAAYERISGSRTFVGKGKVISDEYYK